MRITIAPKFFFGFVCIIILNVFFFVIVSNLEKINGITNILKQQNEIKNQMLRLKTLHRIQRPSVTSYIRLSRQESVDNFNQTQKQITTLYSSISGKLDSIESLSLELIPKRLHASIDTTVVNPLTVTLNAIKSYNGLYTSMFDSIVQAKARPVAEQKFAVWQKILEEQEEKITGKIDSAEIIVDTQTNLRIKEVELKVAEVKKTTIYLILIVTFSALVFGFLFSNYITTALRRLTIAARTIGKGDFNVDPHRYPKDEIGDLASAFFQMSVDLKNAQEMLIRSKRLAAIGEIVASVNHEINNPLMIISGNAQFLQMTMTDTTPESRERVQTILEETERISKVTRKLREIKNPVIEDYTSSGEQMINLDKSST